jgi:hypothetical protein
MSASNWSYSHTICQQLLKAGDDMPTLILPAAGSAERMGGIPKFLLPTGNGKENLLSRWINSSRSHVDKILIASSPLFFEFLKETYSNTTTEVRLVKSRSMAETVKIQLGLGDSIVAMPDTFISDPDEFFNASNSFLSNKSGPLAVSVWEMREHQKGKVGQVRLENSNILEVIDKDPECLLPKFWGALCFTPDFHDLISLDDPHLGTAINRAILNNFKVPALIMEGSYKDCGTIDEYKGLLLSP